MKYLITVIFLVSLSTTLFAQTTYYVDQETGDDDYTGTSLVLAFETIEAATGVVTAGDTVLIVGEYKNESFEDDFTYINEHDPKLWHSENSIKINNLNGTSSAYITFKPFNNNTVLRGDGGNIFRVSNSSYLRIEGFTIEGEVENIPLSTANALQFVYIDADNVVDENDPTAAEIKYRNEDCVSNCNPDEVVEGEIYTDISDLDVKRPSYIDTRGLYLTNVHHIDIINNTIFNMPGGGLRVSDCEDINIIGNEVYACSRKSYSGTHGLVVTKATSTRTTNDYRINILKNKVHHNYNEQYSWSPSKTIITPVIDEGKGISLQRNQTTFNTDGTINVNWENGRILVANNLCYFNGFSGVHSNNGNRIDMINNTAYFNSYTKSITEGITSNNGGNIGISAQSGSDIRIINNISIIDTGLSKSAIASNVSQADGLVVKDNIIYGTTLAGVTGSIEQNANVMDLQENTQMVDPLFVNPTAFDFTLQENSPAVDAADEDFAPAEDYTGAARDDNPDIGAYEFFEILSVPSRGESILVIYPNPASDILYIENRIFSESDIRIYNILGQDFTALISTETNSINISQLASGLYFLQTKNELVKFYKE